MLFGVSGLLLLLLLLPLTHFDFWTVSCPQRNQRVNNLETITIMKTHLDNPVERLAKEGGEVGWGQVKCSEEARAFLRDVVQVEPSVAKKLVDDLGFTKLPQFSLISAEDVKGLKLKPLEERGLLDFLASYPLTPMQPTAP